MGILNYLQRIGRALMVPVATLPAAAILMGVGYWIDPTGWGADNVVAAFLIKSGAAIIDNMSMLFAIGIAYGMSKDKDGAAALTGFVLMNPLMILVKIIKLRWIHILSYD
ncbi:PTS transporter subunit EIIC, partial [Morganella morganii]